jgi:hypothetical protein
MADTDQGSTEVELDECYVCKDTTGKLVRPCTNEKCAGRIHPKCLEEQHASENDECGVCKEPIYYSVKKQTFDTKTCIKTNIKTLYKGFILLCGPIIIALIMLGRSISPHPGYNDTITKCNNNFPLLHPGAWLLLTVIFVRLPPSLCGSYWSYQNTPIIGNALRNIKYKSYLIMAILFGISIVLISGSHLIGQFVLNGMYDIDARFNCLTSAYGLIVYGIIIGIVTASIVIMLGIHQIYKYNVDSFSLKELEFGVTIDNAEDKYLLHKQ